MKYYLPDYYEEFKCIAQKCKHSCCVGWEIDIDDDTLAYYNSVDGKIGEKLRRSISTDDTPHFILDKKQRCPFLDKDGLCQLILELGEDALCGICTDHPRFRNFYLKATEIGLGLCCEAVGELILKRDKPFKINGLNFEDGIFEPEEEYILAFRQKLIDIMQNRELTIKERHIMLLDSVGLEISKPNIDFFLSLERLDDKWTDILQDLKDINLEEFYDNNTTFDIAYEQLTCYFLFRHIPSAIWDGNISAKVRLAVISCQLISGLMIMHKRKYKKASIDDLIEYARMYSSEVEYSEENIEAF